MTLLSPDERFQYAVSVVLSHEGGYSCDKEDPGGATNFGITLDYLKEVNPVFLKKIGIVNPNQSHIVKLTEEKAIALYKQGYWDKYHYEAFNSLDLATKVFDTAVNIGSLRAHMFLQSAINALGKHTLVVDGILGGLTIGAANESNAEVLIDSIREDMRSLYIHLINKYPKLKKFEKGWFKRASF